MSEFGFTRVPDDVRDALGDGDINQTQFIILVLMHSWAGYTTGMVKSFSAERVLRALGVERPPDDAPRERVDRYKADLRGMQKQIRALRLAEWFHGDYQEGSKRPYNVWIHNYVVGDEAHIRSKNPASPDSDGERDAEKPSPGTVLYPCTVTSCRPLRDLKLAERDAEENAPVSLKRGDFSPNNQSADKVEESTDSKAALSLIHGLESISATELHRTRVVPANLREKFGLIVTAYPAETVRADFGAWCHEQLMAHKPIPKTPIIEYLKVIDHRLGKTEPPPDINDPRIAEFSGVVYDRTGFLPNAHSLAALLAKYELDELLGAFNEYADTLERKEYKTAMRTFFAESGATAVIFARRRRAAEISAPVGSERAKVEGRYGSAIQAEKVTCCS